jgi:hypothetical protein
VKPKNTMILKLGMHLRKLREVGIRKFTPIEYRMRMEYVTALNRMQSECVHIVSHAVVSILTTSVMYNVP